MTEFQGRGHLLDGGFSLPFYPYRSYIKYIYKIVVFQAALCYILYSLGVTFSLASYHDHLTALYTLFFGIAVLLYESNSPFSGLITVILPAIEEDMVKHALYFLVGVPNIFCFESFYFQLGSIIFAVVGLLGAATSFRYGNLLGTYLAASELPTTE
ncbi:conserved hypothetical protein [Theileria equi strain WA]|uniref:Uncharacterized protein n=1 Tax=Theileria equi strain WA TaxID=1537102 RepID=L1LG54_THEEQ|nr:conserved hypothetical protein [Theileria equi strain WA]EKX74422.1 conserved hypothetical protein [Theileria equi strain WA]|eukprot:XP_004833874.1 conserved hypothetical protein [Theileria equi strain WA]